MLCMFMNNMCVCVFVYAYMQCVGVLMNDEFMSCVCEPVCLCRWLE